MRLAELAVVLLPLLGVLLWGIAVARGLRGPPPRQLALLFLLLVILGGTLTVLASRERLPPGRYVPAELKGGRILPGHSE